MKTIPLTQGKVAIVDDEDFEYLNQWKWSYTSHGYAKRVKNDECIYMHRLINRTPKNRITDHINGNGLDNQKKNLRSVTNRQNKMNQRKRHAFTSKYKGVHYIPDRPSHKRSRHWTSQIRHNDSVFSLGYFLTEEEAGLAYDARAKELFGKYAVLNFP